MEMKAKQASSLANVVVEDFLELSSDDRFKLRTAGVIECPGQSLHYRRPRFGFCLGSQKRRKQHKEGGHH